MTPAPDFPGGASEQDLMPHRPPEATRIAAIDVARSIAIAAMVIYHFTWDLEFFGHVERGLTLTPGWKLFARSIASSFLILTGISLVLAHGKQIVWNGFSRRFAMVAGAALLITIATWFAFPDSFIFFGILHQIALASLLGLAFLRLPWIVTALAAAAVIALPFAWRSDVFAHPALLWSGLAPVPPRSNDYVPVFPWFGAVLAGMALAQAAISTGLLNRLAQWPASRLPLWITWPGRHSLALYLVHQPLLLGLVWTFTQVSPPSVTVAGSMPLCVSQCRETREETFCQPYCQCLLDALASKGILTPVMTGKANEEQTRQTGMDRDLCLVKQADKTE